MSGFNLIDDVFCSVPYSRSLNGALNGNIGVLKSMMAEITDSTNLAYAYAYLPIAWSTGGTLGYVLLAKLWAGECTDIVISHTLSPIIGGALSHPAERFPSTFGNNKFLKTYPYFLPCAVPATFSAIAFLITYIFLKEVRPSRSSSP